MLCRNCSSSKWMQAREGRVRTIQFNPQTHHLEDATPWVTSKYVIRGEAAFVCTGCATFARPAGLSLNLFSTLLENSSLSSTKDENSSIANKAPLVFQAEPLRQHSHDSAYRTTTPAGNTPLRRLFGSLFTFSSNRRNRRKPLQLRQS